MDSDLLLETVAEQRRGRVSARQVIGSRAALVGW
jgi:hypothetical protein